MKKYFLIIFLSFLFIVIIAVINSFKIYEGSGDNAEISQYAINAEEAQFINNNSSSYSIGTSTPIITIIEFSDFACPYCKNSFPTMREISLKYQDKVKIIYRHYPIITEHSSLLGLAAECAGEQNKFWAMHDSLFLNQGISTADELKELARQIGLNSTQFNNCLNEQRYLDKITKDFEAGKSLEITGTPTWYINDVHVAGDIPPNIFFELIDSLLIQNN